jgi:exopolysaccharide biosynthesis predicted pyruvyltransferase EpsI
LRIIQRFKKNPIVISPVTCWYESADLMRQDAEIMAKHPNLTICARDTRSFDLLKKHFNNRILLMPDMAFCIERTTLVRHVAEEGEGTLFLKRTDKELAPNTPSQLKEVPGTMEIHDWPSMEKEPQCWIRYRKLCKLGQTIGRFHRLKGLSHMVLKASDWYYHEHCRIRMIQDGVRFIGRYRNIYTTRLHVGILSILLDKSVTIIDNSYGKNASFFETWLNDTDGVTFWKTQ